MPSSLMTAREQDSRHMVYMFRLTLTWTNRKGYKRGFLTFVPPRLHEFWIIAGTSVRDTRTRLYCSFLLLIHVRCDEVSKTIVIGNQRNAGRG